MKNNKKVTSENFMLHNTLDENMIISSITQDRLLKLIHCLFVNCVDLHGSAWLKVFDYISLSEARVFSKLDDEELKEEYINWLKYNNPYKLKELKHELEYSGLCYCEFERELQKEYELRLKIKCALKKNDYSTAIELSEEIKTMTKQRERAVDQFVTFVKHA